MILKTRHLLLHGPLMVVVVVLLSWPLLTRQKAGAYGLVVNRNIAISSPIIGSFTAGQNVIYNVGFTTATGPNSIGSVVVEFCSNSPIIGDSCSAPAGFDINKATLGVFNQAGITGLSVDVSNSTANTAVLTRIAGAVASSVPVSFELGNGSNGITNPVDLDTFTAGNQPGTYYSRIYTYQNNDGTGINYDAGGVALSTTDQFNVTSKVQERLTFCVYTGGVGYASNDCSGKSGSSLSLGDTTGQLDPAGPYVNKTGRYTLSSNASGDVAVRLKGDTLKNGVINIAATGASAVASAPGTEQFGLCTWQQAGSGLTAVPLYDGSSNGGTGCSSTIQTAGGAVPGGDGGATFGYDISTPLTNITSTYGQIIATKPAGNFSTGELAFIGNISTITPAGLYSASLLFIATGTY